MGRNLLPDAANILLIHPFAGRRTFCPPLGTLYIAAALRQAGYDVRVLDMDVDEIKDEEVLKLVRERNPLFTGISCNVVQVNEALRLGEKIKKEGGRVVVGGPITSIAADLVLNKSWADFCVIGEGERTIVELARALGENLPVEEVAGLAFKGDSKTDITKTAIRAPIIDLDTLPFPAHDLNGDIKRYARIPSPAPSPPIAAVLPSRGCPYKCTFCSNPWQGTNRKRSAGNVVKEISYLVSEFGVKEIFFYDDSFNSDSRYVKELCSRIIEKGLKISWRADCRADAPLLDEEMMRLMKESGCWLLAFGVETGNVEIMRKIKKGLRLEDVRRARELCKRAGILFRTFFMVGNLGEDYGTIFDTICLAKELDPDDCQFSIFTPITGTKAYEEAKGKGWIIDPSWERLDSFHATVSTDKLSSLDTEALHRLASLTVPAFWKTSLNGMRMEAGNIDKKMQEAYGHKGKMMYELYETYKRNRGNERAIVVLNPPSPPKFTVSRDTMGGLGQVLKGDFLPVIPPVDMAYLVANLRKDGEAVHAIDAPGSFLDVEHTLKFVASLTPGKVMLRTSVPTLEWDRALGERMAEELKVEVEYFGPCIEGSPRFAPQSPVLPAWDLMPPCNLGALTDNRRYLPIQGSLGCPYDCDYCPYPLIQGTKHAVRKPEHIFQEMLHWKKELGVDYFLFRDPVFSLQRKWVEELCHLLEGQGISWRCETRADLLNDHLLEMMARAGCKGVNLGLETITEACLQNVHRKPISEGRLKAVVEKCKELGIETFVFYIVGLPGEDRDSFKKTLELANQLATPHVQFLPAIPYPGTRLEKWARSNGFITGSLTDPAHYGTEPVMRNETLTTAEIKELCEMAQFTLTGGANSVSAAKCDSYDKVEEAVRRAVDELGGMASFVKPGQRVLIKPNLIGAYPPQTAVTTHPAVVKAVASLVKSAGGIPLIGDSPGGGEVYHYKSYRNLLSVTGMEAVARAVGCETVDFSTGGISMVPVEGKILNEVMLTDVALQADVIISLPKVKTHAFQYFTGAIKNMYGLVPGLKKAEYHKRAPSPQEFASLMVDVFQAVKDKVKLVVMDAVVSMEGRGPTAGNPVKTGFVLASKDAILADAATCLTLGLDPQQSPIIAEALQRFFRGRKFNINIRGENFAELKASSFKPPFYESQDSFIEAHANIYPFIDGVRCKECRKCIQSCPVRSISDDFVIDTSNCIKCLCCHEVCPHNAIELVKRRKTEIPSAPVALPRAGVRPEGSLRGAGNGKLRMLVVSNLYPPHYVGGYELACREIVEKLMERGHEVMVLTSMFGLDGPREDGHIRRILDHSYASGDGAFFLDMPFSAYNEHIIKSTVEAFRPQAFYLWNFHGLSMQSVMRSVARSNIPYLFHAMDYHLLSGYGSLQKWQEPTAEEFLSSPSCRIAAMSETVRTKFLRQGYVNTFLVYHGVDLKEPASTKQKGGFHLLYSGQLRHNKGLHILITAMQAACKEGHRLSLDVYGKGDKSYEEQIRRFTRDNRMAVVFHGTLPREEFLNKYELYDAFIFPALREEPFGIVMIEAMNAGLPVIASGEGGPKEIIVHGETGLWFPAGDVNRLKECLIELANSRELKEKLSHNGRALVKEKFNIERSVSQIEELLDFTHTPQHAWRRKSEKKGDVVVSGNVIGVTEKSEAKGAPAIVWNAPIYDPSGYADEARNFVLALERHGGTTLKLRPIQWSTLTAELSPQVLRSLRHLAERNVKGDYINVMHIFPDHYRRDSQAALNIGRTMFETDRIPRSWVEACSAMDEIWVPTQFNLDTFTRSGVADSKLFKVPGCIDVEKYNQSVEPLKIEGSANFNFLSPFDWCLRKGWDVLLRAYCREFRQDEDVSLILKVYSTLGYTPRQIRECVSAYIRSVLGMAPSKAPHIIILEAILPDEEMLRLYKAAQALVMPSRCEGWGRPFMEAMTMGLPAIGTGWSGNTEFMNSSNSFLLDYRIVQVPEEACREIPKFRGHRWAEPSEEHLREMMRYVFQNRAAAAEKGSVARRHIMDNYNWEKVAGIIIKRVKELSGDRIGSPRGLALSGRAELAVAKKHEARPAGSPRRVIWEGEQFTSLSLALVNRNLCYYLESWGRCELSLATDEPQAKGLARRARPEGKAVVRDKFSRLAERIRHPLSGPADFHVRHRWPPDFNSPESGHWVMIQPWEFGALPEEWVKPMEELVDELWVPSNYVRRCYLESGISKEKVFVIPNGVDIELFNPDIDPMPLLTRKKFLFLFVGGLFWRKGIDVLLSAYLSSFTRKDDVCLVIKDLGANYGDGFRLKIDQLIKDCQSSRTAPEILRLSEELSGENMARLYRSCHCLVHPFRGEGFGLPVAEAMACGLPVIVTRGGACDEFCTDDTAFFVPAVRVEAKMQEKTAGQPWLLEPNQGALANWMKYVASHTQEVRERGRAAGEFIRDRLSWEKSAKMVQERLETLSAQPIRRLLKSCSEETAIAKQVNASSGARSLEELHRLVEMHPGEPQLHNQLGEALFNTGEHERARQEFEKTLELDHAGLDALNNLGAVHWAKGELDAALDSFRRVLEADENNQDAMFNCGMVCVHSGRDEEAVSLLQRYIAVSGDDLKARVALSEALSRTGKIEEAQAQLDFILRADTNPAERGADGELLENLKQSRM